MVPTLTEALGPDEDWSGLKDAKLRRKLQNRLNVRAHRRRKALLSKTKSQSTDPVIVGQVEQCHSPEGKERETQRDAYSLMVKFSKLQLQGSHGASGDQTIIFPLTLDHLIPLVQYNFIRGVLTNMAILGMQNAFAAECSRHWMGMPLFPAPSTIPESLQQTELQRNTPHEPWIDLIPDKKMRDNAILATGAYKREDIDTAVAGSITGQTHMIEMSGLIAWGDPWQPEGWEMTEGFIKKFPFLVKGCWSILESTNRWRALRDEEPLVVEL
ncbi:uncharacterized protein F4812DRAFT_441465 [Daldinia caldariorum]|uniref:uncharacterized protein n=1 Tax=Daldinia caldariorum TaxID=326644 RepID=UPI0020077F86|nr:uncharacterized protein F4812DRAFT_441465 [Daldinia caldariorum]KAI1464664.1 hypothetical protein F4812DRAFT_441465 [Daldinia caldariorum]